MRLCLCGRKISMFLDEFHVTLECAIRFALQIGCTSLHVQVTLGQSYHITKNDNFVHSLVFQAQW